jgi:hypothetical protein
MQIFNYFLLICFINLSNSFISINKKYFTNFHLQNYKNKLNMGCDYYIDKNLYIYDYNNIILSYINLEHERGYYWFYSLLDEDEDGYDKELTSYIKDTLEPSMKPIVIYSNNNFNKLSFQNKYKKLIENDLELVNKTLNDVNKIIKIEKRYER